MLRNACRQNCLGVRTPPPQHARQSMRDAHLLAFLLTRASLAAPFVLRINLELLRPEHECGGDGQNVAAAFIPRRAHALSVGRVPRAVEASGARAVHLYLRARGAHMAREPEVGLEAAAMDVIR